MTNRTVSKEEMCEKVLRYKYRNWITEKQANALLKALNDATTLQIDKKRTEKELICRIQSSLDKIKKRHKNSGNKHSSHCQDKSFSSGLVPLMNISDSIANQTINRNSPYKMKKRHDQSKQTDSTKFQEKSISSEANPIITSVSMTDQNNNKIFLPSSISDHHQLADSVPVSIPYSVANLFVEMCFFARLGFVQPPSCLKCVHQLRFGSSKKSHLPAVSCNSSCQRYVAWRRDASKLLHPNNLQENLMFVPCRYAQKLLLGEEVQGWKWHAKEKRCNRKDIKNHRTISEDILDKNTIMKDYVSQVDWDENSRKETTSMISSFR